MSVLIALRDDEKAAVLAARQNALDVARMLADADAFRRETALLEERRRLLNPEHEHEVTR